MGRFALAADSKAQASRCSFGAYLDGLSDEDRADLVEMSQRMSIRAIRDIIIELDERAFDKDTLKRHFSGRCRCPAS